MKLKNIEIDEVSLVSEPANPLSVGKFTKSRKNKDITKSEDKPKEEAEDSEKADCPECEGKEDCQCADKAEEPAEEALEAVEEVSEALQDAVEAVEEAVAVADEAQQELADDEDDMELKKSAVEIKAMIKKLQSENAALIMEKALFAKTAEVKSLGAPEGLIEPLAKHLVQNPAGAEPVVQLIKAYSAAVGENFGKRSTTAEPNVKKGALELEQASELVKSGKVKSYAQALAIVRRDNKENK
jgi:hypothetical protein